MNNSYTRVIAGGLLVVSCFVFVGAGGDLSKCLRFIQYQFVDVLVYLIIPVFFLFILLEIGERKKVKNIYLYGACIGFLIGFIDGGALGFMIDYAYDDDCCPSQFGWRFVGLLAFLGSTLGAFLGILIAVPLQYLYKKDKK